MKKKITRFFLMTVTAMFFCTAIIAQNTNEYRLTGSDDGDNMATWERFDGISRVQAWSATSTGPEFTNDHYIVLTATKGITGQFLNPVLPPGYVIDHSVPNEAALQKLTFALPLRWAGFSAGRNNKKEVMLEWVTVNESNTLRFEIERSADGQLFYSIGTIPASGHTSANTAYHFTDLGPAVSSISYYRIKQVDTDETYSYSSVIHVNAVKMLFTVSVTPNPVPAGAKLNIIITGTQDKEKLVFELINIDGMVVHKEQVQVSASSVTRGIERPVLAEGIYLYKVTRINTGELFTGKLFFK